MSTITKLSLGVTQYYKNITSPIGANVRIQKRYIIMNGTKGAHESQRENSRAEQGAREDRVLDGLPMFYTTDAHLN